MNIFLFALYFCANDDTPCGLRIHGPCLRVREYKKDASATAIGFGDLVAREADGCIVKKTAADGKKSVGVSLKYSATTTLDASIPVADHPDQEFVIQGDASATLTEAALGANADVTTATVNTTTGLSAQELSSTGVTANAADLRIIALAKNYYPSGVQNAWGAWQDLIVKIAEHAYANEAGI